MKKSLRDGGETPSKKVRETAQRFPEMIAMRYKELGLWQETTYENFWLKSNYLSMALRYFGVTKGDSVAILSENRPEWFISDIGIQSKDQQLKHGDFLLTILRSTISAFAF